MGGYYFFVGFNLEKCENLGKTAIFLSDMAGLGICNMGGYGRIGVEMDKMFRFGGPLSKIGISPKLSIHF